MKAGCQIRTSSKAGRNNPAVTAHSQVLNTLRFPTHSKTLSNFSRLQGRQRRSSVLAQAQEFRFRYYGKEDGLTNLSVQGIL